MSPKRVYILDPETLKIDGFAYDEPGPVPPLISPPDENEPKDTAPPEPEKKPKPS
jgi:hypothetical protein